MNLDGCRGEAPQGINQRQRLGCVDQVVVVVVGKRRKGRERVEGRKRMKKK